MKKWKIPGFADYRKIYFTIFSVLLVLLLCFSLLPIIIVNSQSINNLNNTKKITQSTVEDTFEEQAIKLYTSTAENISSRISDFLYTCVRDLETLELLDENSQTYLNFYRKHTRYSNIYKKDIPLYRQISVIDKNGNETIKIENDQIVKKEYLVNVSTPENTTYKTEIYFQKAKTSPDSFYISHLNNWYISRNEQLEHNKKPDGLYRFCRKKFSRQGEFDGIYMLALDFQHLLDFVEYKRLEQDNLVTKYKEGSYKYLLDDEGWITAHQKLWDIRGFDKNGIVIESFSENTPTWKYESGIIPINLLNMDWRLKDNKTDTPISEIYKRARRGESVFTTMESMGIYGQSPGIIRSRIYTPIFFDVGPYKKYSVFGVVSVGASEKAFFDKVNLLVENIEEINSSSERQILIITLFFSIAVIVLSLVIARSMSRSLKKLNSSLSQIGRGHFEIPETKSSIKEINELSHGVKKLSAELSRKENELNHNMRNLELLNSKLVKAEKELATYWKYEYANEPDDILENQILRLEDNFPKLKDIRRNTCIGSHTNFLRVLRQVVAQSQMILPTWLSGESGVGKTSIAKTIHMLSPRSDKPYSVFAASEFSAADPIIVQGKLFGYGENHGIAGIDRDGVKGIIEESDGGTIFIDDVDALPLETQAQLLRVVDGLDFHPAVGKGKSIFADVRFLFASHSDLKTLVMGGLFRKDLFRRIGGNFNRIEIPPLRERRSDILELAKHFLMIKNVKAKTNFTISESALNILMNHDYLEGNLGELKVLIQYACENARLDGSEEITCKYLSIKSNSSNETREKSDFVTQNFLNEGQLMKLDVLRKNNFLMALSEEELGFQKGSKALSHHFRGICLKLLSENGENIARTVVEITGDSKCENDKIASKIERYLENIKEKTETRQTSSLYKNLPKEYHNYLTILIDKYPATS